VSTYPVFVFERRHEVEIESQDLILAGTLRLNTFGRRRPTRRQRLECAEIIRGLTHDAQAGRIKPGGRVIGWPGDGRKPESAVDTSDEEVMRSWLKRAFKVSLRVDLRSDDERVLPPFDHDAQAARV
jgi:hypothetical protein